MTHGRNAHAASALRAFADYLENSNAELASDVVSALEDTIDTVIHDEAMRDSRAREAAGEKAVPSAEVRKILGL